MATTTTVALSDSAWSAIVSDAAETLLASDGNGFFYAIAATPPAAAAPGHPVPGFENEAVVTLDGENLYARSVSGGITLVVTVDA